MLAVILLASLSVFCRMAHAGAVPRSLVARQVSPFPGGTTIPAICVSTCSAPMNTVNQCGTMPQPTCLCSVDFQQGLFECFACLGQAVMATNFTIPQQTLDNLTTACDSAGIPLPNLTIVPQISMPTPTPPATTQTVPASLPLDTTLTVPTSLPPATTTPSNQTAGAMKSQVLSGDAWVLSMVFIAIGMAIYDIGISV